MILDNKEFTIPCNECQAGHMRRVFVTYFTWLGEELITVPDFPAWRCDVCGRREYDVHSLNQLSLLLNPNAGTPTHARPRPKRQKPKDRPARPPKTRED
jgi:YgiT-type zinc finger domain-containing protein